MEHYCGNRYLIYPIGRPQSIIRFTIIVIITIKQAPIFQRPSHQVISKNASHLHISHCSGCHKWTFTQEKAYSIALIEDKMAEEVFLSKAIQPGSVTKRAGFSHSRILFIRATKGCRPHPFSKIKTPVPAHSSGSTSIFIKVPVRCWFE